MPQHSVMPFSALVGQQRLKQALLLLAVNPKLNGLLIRGEKGTAKSTAARALARLLPPISVNDGCSFNCSPDKRTSWCLQCRNANEPVVVERQPRFETLPLGITEDQLVGTIDLEHALRYGKQQFAPGLLARVNQGVLYVDEVNLLEDHIVDLLLDVAAMGVNVVAREGITLSHPAEFLLIGTMNPEEGVLRPQFQDRFGLCAEIRTIESPEERALIIERCLSFESDPIAFHLAWANAESELTETIMEARQRLPQVVINRDWCEAAAELSLELGVHGHRPDVLMVKTMATLAALDGRQDIQADDMESASLLVYPHRLRRRPFETKTLSDEEVRDQAHQVASATEKKKT